MPLLRPRRLRGSRAGAALHLGAVSRRRDDACTGGRGRVVLRGMQPSPWSRGPPRARCVTYVTP